MQYRREIDGLRALAVIPVILFHAGFQVFSGGFVGVDIFFVISGYLITSIIVNEKSIGDFSFLGFYDRRVRRILPALYFVMFSSLPFAAYLMLPGELKEFSESVIAATGFASNVFFWKTSGYFGGAAELKPLLHTWSLAVEEQYYIIFPLLLSAVWGIGRKKVVLVFIVIALLSLATAQWGVINKPSATFFLLPTRSFELLIGAVVALYLNTKKYHISNASSQVTTSQLASAVGGGLIVFSLLFFDKDTPFPSVYALVPTAGAALIICFASPITVVGKILSSRLFVGVGLISYSAYLWHQPLFAFTRIAYGTALSNSVLILLCLFTLVLAYFTWKYVEVPFRDRSKYDRLTAFKYAGIGGFCFLAIGFFGSSSNGLLFRYSDGDIHLASIHFPTLGKYVDARFNERMMKGFDQNDVRKKILVIGDSYSQDLVNAVFETDADRRLQISTRYILRGCGNLFMKRSDFVQKMTTGNAKQCSQKVPGFGFEELYDDQLLRNLMLEADEVWYASAWEYWQAELISRSVENTVHLTGKTVKVFGRKSFGEIDIRKLLSLDVKDRISFVNRIDVGAVNTNSLMKRQLKSNVFVDVQSLLCGDLLNECKIFTDKGELISYDGGHLTVYGAKYFGSKLLGAGFLVN
jgi:peptidoglycan/LPS O-acetylase OafA/YrhL